MLIFFHDRDFILNKKCKIILIDPNLNFEKTRKSRTVIKHQRNRRNKRIRRAKERDRTSNSLNFDNSLINNTLVLNSNFESSFLSIPLSFLELDQISSLIPHISNYSSISDPAELNRIQNTVSPCPEIRLESISPENSLRPLHIPPPRAWNSLRKSRLIPLLLRITISRNYRFSISPLNSLNLTVLPSESIHHWTL